MAIHEKWYCMKVVCLASGGIDSSVLMFMLKKSNHEVCPLHINYGQKAEKMELKSVQEICKILNLSLEVIDVPGLAKISSGLTDPHISVSEYPLFPARNLLLLAIGSSYASTKSIEVISIGLLANPIFPDQTIKFVKSTENAINDAMGTMKILVPFIELNKREVVGLAKKYEFPLNLTYSCYEGLENPCGKCASCQERTKVENFQE